jgi:hypothetical protein
MGKLLLNPDGTKRIVRSPVGANLLILARRDQDFSTCVKDFSSEEPQSPVLFNRFNSRKDG